MCGTSTADGAEWTILGLAVETRSDRPEPAAGLKALEFADVPQAYESWAGRWVLIGGGRVHLNASGLLGCFYAAGKDGRTWASSSPALLRPLLRTEKADRRELSYEVGISWYPPPQSRFEEARRLLPSQVLDLATGAVEPRRLIPPIDFARPYDETLQLIMDSLVTAVRRLPETQKRLWLGLTAGYDSRALLAVAGLANVGVTAFTRVTPRMSTADRLLPALLAQKSGIEHFYLRTDGAPKTGRDKIVREHSAGHVSAGDAHPLLTGARDQLDGISFGGHGFGVPSG